MFRREVSVLELSPTHDMENRVKVSREAAVGIITKWEERMP